MGSCPFCGGDEFIAGIKDAVTEGETERFMCLGCDESGIPEDLVEALEGQAETIEKLSRPEIIDKPRLGKNIQLEEKKFVQNQGDNDRVEEKKTVASSEMRMKESLLILLRRISPLNLSGKELMIVVFLYLFPKQFKATMIGKLLRIPQKNVHRILAGLEEIGIISSTQEKPLKYSLSSKLR